MSLPASQRRVLGSIERRLAAGEPRLASMFRIFAQLTRDELLPGRETIPSGWRPAVVAARLRQMLSRRRAARRRSQLRRNLRGRQRPSRLGRIGMTLAPLVLLALLSGAVVLGIKTPSASGCSVYNGRLLTGAPSVHGKKCAIEPVSTTGHGP